jgi:hydroxyacylglutathione hydrolase
MDEATPYFLEAMAVGAIQVNCYLFGCSATRESAIIDPGGDAAFIKTKVEERQALVKMILLTHGHYDHLGALEEIRKTYDCPVMIHADDAPAVTNPMVNLSAMMGVGISSHEAERLLGDGDRIQLGRLTLDVMHTPGHTRGGVCFHWNGLLFSGDTLFNTGVGRTDLPGGSIVQLEQSIRMRLYSLPDDTLVLPGHGDSTTVGFEKKNNPFVRAK